mgnify:CR=1 FL=1
MKLKKNILIFLFLLMTTTFLIINFKNTSKTYLYFLNFKTEKLTIGNYITLSFLAGFTATYSFLYITSPRSESDLLNDQKINTESKNINEKYREYITNSNEDRSERPPERNLRDSQPTISVNYRVIKRDDKELNDINEEYSEIKNQILDDWEENESNW